jgi:hypothetical protein
MYLCIFFNEAPAGPCANHAVLIYRAHVPWALARVLWAGALKGGPVSPVCVRLCVRVC